MPKCVCFFIFTFDKLNILILLFESLVQSFLLVFVVDYWLLISAHSLLELSFTEAHFGVAVRQEVLEPLVFNLKLIEFEFLLF
jgi:hypothetical protein